MIPHHLECSPTHHIFSIQQGHGMLGEEPTSTLPQIAEPRSSIAKSLQTQSPGESKTSGVSRTETAQRWFDQSNKHPAGAQIDDDDLPFLLEQPSPPKESNDVTGGGQGEAQNESGHQLLEPTRAGYMQTATNGGSSADDFRSVIDDLTIENKKLKERLRRYERKYTANLEKDKLFEIEIHGLPPRKKRKLEEMLHSFASSVDGYPPVSRRPRDVGNHTTSQRPLDNHDSSSTGSSSVRPLDSAYASMSASVPTSIANSNRADVGTTHRHLSAQSKERGVQSFLKDIPQGLMPKHPLAMTEKSKKNLVVRRLEQIFTGKRLEARGPLSHPQQQEEISRSAARADQKENESRGHQMIVEGVREAHILSSEMDLDRENTSILPSKGKAGVISTGSNPSTSPEQRPTRPLDLDPDRAQIPSENLEYIRHLGPRTSTKKSEEFSDTSATPVGWIYLNLLVNMAQLHIINVTPDFVRSAVEEVSDKFELSEDGKKIRWKGGTEGTVLNSESGEDSPHIPDNGDSHEVRPKRRRVEASPRPMMAGKQTLTLGQFPSVPITKLNTDRLLHTTNQTELLSYRPLFHHQRLSDSESGSKSWSSSFSRASCSPAEGGKYEVAAADPPKRDRNRRREGGIIVFYSGAPFCTDLSADRGDISTPLHVTEVGRDGYSNHTTALGCKSDHDQRSVTRRTNSGSTLNFRPFKDYSKCADSLEPDGGPQPDTPERISQDDLFDLDFSPQWSPRDSDQDVRPLPMEASGLGGTQPADHFVITVRTSRTKLDFGSRMRLSKFSAPSSRTKEFLHKIYQASLLKASLLSFRYGSDTLTESLVTGVASLRAKATLGPQPFSNVIDLPVKIKVLSTVETRLWPSMLPQAGYFLPISSSEEWSMASSDNGITLPTEWKATSQRTTNAHHIVAHQLPCVDFEQQYAGFSRASSSSDIDSDDISIDMLAHARLLDPEQVRAREIEFDAELEQRRAEEGSSRATVDGGSVDWSEISLAEDDDGHGVEDVGGLFG